MTNNHEMNKGLLENDTLNEILGNDKIKTIEEKYVESLHNKPILSGTELMLLPDMDNNYLVEHLLWEDDVAVLLSKEKVGKSIFSIQMACALTCGGTFLNEYDILEPMKVLYVQAEGSRRETIKNLRNMLADGTVKWNAENFYHAFPSALSLDIDEGLNDMIDKIVDNAFIPRVIFVDPLYMAMAGGLTDEKASRKFCRHIRVLKEKFNSTIFICHHENRGTKDEKGNQKEMGDNSIMGSFVWKAFPSHIIRLKKRDDGIRVLSCETDRGGNIVKNMELKLVEPIPLYFKVNSGEFSPSVDKVFRCLKDAGDEGYCAQQVAVSLRISESTARQSFSYLREKGLIYKTNPGKCPVLYKVKEGA